MRYLLMPLGSAGDVHPFVGLGLELRRRGHEVILVTNGYFASLAARFNLDMIEIGTYDDFVSGIAAPDLWHPTRSFSHLYRELILPTIDKQYEVISEFSSRGPVTVLANCFGFGALNAQEKFGIPVVSVHLQPLLMWSRIEPPRAPALFGPRWFQAGVYALLQRMVIDPTVLPSLNTIRHRIGLSPVSGVMNWWHSKTLLLCLFPEWFCPPQADWPQPTTQVDFPLWDERNETNQAMATELPERLEEFLEAGSSPIAFTPGSANIFGKSFFETAVKACERTGRRGVFLTRFTEQIPRHLPDSILHVPFVPLSCLLPRCAAFVHHGGIGSAAQAMASGVPQLIRPLAHDQFDNAARIVKAGIGESLSPSRFTPTRVAAALTSLLDSKVMAVQCAKIANRIQYGRGLSQAADRLDQLLH